MGVASHLKKKQDELPGSELHHHDISLQVIVRGMPGSMPSKREIEERIIGLLRSIPQPGEGGYCGWDIPGVMMPPVEGNDDQSG